MPNIKKNRPTISYSDVMQASVNGQESYQGAGPLAVQDDSKVYFIANVDGGPVTIKDTNGVTVAILKDKTTTFPFRMDGGFTASAAGAFTLMYWYVPVLI